MEPPDQPPAVPPRTEPSGDDPRWPRLTVAMGVLVVVVGIGARAWLAWGHLGIPDSDEAVSGLVARHVLHGHVPVFYWGQSYGGTIEELLIAGWFRVVGVSSASLKTVPAVLGLVGVGLTWRIGRRSIGGPAAAVAAALATVWPLGGLYWSTKARGFYGVVLVLSLVVVLMVLRLADGGDDPRRERRDRGDLLDWVVLGAAAGLAWWSSPLSALVVVPAGSWLLARRRPGWLEAMSAAGALVVALVPWLVWNVRHHWLSLSSPPQRVAHDGYLDHLQRFVVRGWPLALGLEVPLRAGWVVGPVIGPVVAGLVVAALVWIVVRSRGPLRLLAFVAACYPFLLALTPDAYYFEDTRYLYLLQPFLALLVAATLHRFRVELMGLAVAAVMSVAGLRSFTPDHQFDVRSLARSLEAHHVDRVAADYWVAYPLDFASDEHIVATPLDGDVRYGPYAREVRAAPDVAFVVAGRASAERSFERRIEGRPVVERFRADGYAIYVLDHHDAVRMVPPYRPGG